MKLKFNNQSITVDRQELLFSYNHVWVSICQVVSHNIGESVKSKTIPYWDKPRPMGDRTMGDRTIFHYVSGEVKDAVWVNFDTPIRFAVRNAVDKSIRLTNYET